MTIGNSRYFRGLSNQSVINVISISASLKHTSPCIIYIIRNATLAGNPNFAPYTSYSCSILDTSGTTVTWSDNSQIIWTGHLGDTGGSLDHNFITGFEEFTIQPGETITVCAKTVLATAAFVTASVNTREDQ